MNNFIFQMPTKVYFGEGQVEHLPDELKPLGTKVLLVYGGGSIKKSGLYQRITNLLRKAEIDFVELSGVDPNPRLTSVETGAALCKKEHVNAVLAVGGGSVIDCAKAIAAASQYDGEAWDLISGKEPVKKALPVATVLTLAATGSEMDNCSVITNTETKEKVGLLDDALIPKVSFLDPTLTYSVSKFQTASGSADILSHILEVYFNMNRDLEMLDREMEGLMKTVVKFAPIALEKPDDYEARANLMWAASWAINGFITGGKAQMWSCHPMEHELSAFYDIAHGLGLAILTPRWMEYVLDETTASKFYDYGVQVFGIDPSLPVMDVARQSIDKTKEFFFEKLELPDTLTAIGIDDTNFERMAEKACGNGVLPAFKPLGKEDIIAIYKMCL